MLRALLLLFALGAAAASAEPAAVASTLRVEAISDGARVRLALSRAPAGAITHFHLAAPDRIVIDIAGASTVRREAPGAGPVRSARLAQFDGRTVRLVLEAAAPMRLAGARLVEAPRGGPVLELEMQASSAAAFAAAVRQGRSTLALSRPDSGPAVPGPLAEIAALLDAPPTSTPAVVPAEAVRRARGRPVVVIDPGHGGKDVGANAVTGGYEKDVTLAVARAAARVL
ncbi:AMIN domain-containing protein, partial [Thermaurantiacus sp.]